MPRRNAAALVDDVDDVDDGNDDGDARVPRDDMALARALVAGERTAGRELCVRLVPMVRRILRHWLGGDADVEDVVHDVFLRLLCDLSKLRDPLALRAFVHTVCVNTIRNEIRSRKVRRLVGLTPSGDLPEPRRFHDDWYAAVALARFHKVLERLSATNRAIFTLRQLEGRSLVEVADAVELSLATVKRRFKAAEAVVMGHARQDATLSAYLDQDEDALGPAGRRYSNGPSAAKRSYAV